MTELRSCPFCGGSAVVIRGPLVDGWTPDDGDDSRTYRPACVAKACGTKGRTRDTEAEAIAAWNRRAE